MMMTKLVVELIENIYTICRRRRLKEEEASKSNDNESTYKLQLKFIDYNR